MLYQLLSWQPDAKARARCVRTCAAVSESVSVPVSTCRRNLGRLDKREKRVRARSAEHSSAGRSFDSCPPGSVSFRLFAIDLCRVSSVSPRVGRRWSRRLHAGFRSAVRTFRVTNVRAPGRRRPPRGRGPAVRSVRAGGAPGPDPGWSPWSGPCSGKPRRPVCVSPNTHHAARTRPPVCRMVAVSALGRSVLKARKGDAGRRAMPGSGGSTAEAERRQYSNNREGHCIKRLGSTRSCELTLYPADIGRPA